MHKNEFDDLSEGVVCKDPLVVPISICFSEKEKERWENLKEQIKEINKKASLSEYARRYLRNMMDDLEAKLAARRR